MGVPGTELDLRVILVGRTGLDAALRLDESIELIRVHSPLEAIGELANPIDPVAPQRAVVILGPDAQRELHTKNNGKARQDPALDLARSLREVDPTVRILAVGVANPGPFDGCINPDQPQESLRAEVRAAIQQAAPGRIQTDHRLGASCVVEPAIDENVSIPQSRAGGADPMSDRFNDRSLGDLTLVRVMLKGQDVAAAAVSLLRERLGDPSIRLLDECGDSAAACVPVTWEGATLCHVQAQHTPAQALAAHARWLAGWLRLRDQQEQLRTAAFCDPLTGAWNRRYFDRFLASALAEAREHRRHVTVMVFDIDNFKQYNDRYGHDAGDEILKETVRLLRSTIRPTDRVCRIGGDEFAVIFHEPEGPRQEGSKHPSSVFAIAHRFQEQVRSHRFPKLTDKLPGTLTISGGLATYPWDGATPAELLARADALALQSKRQGKNAITLGTPEQQR